MESLMGLFDNTFGREISSIQPISGYFTQDDKVRIAQSAQKIANDINKYLKVVRKTFNSKTKLSCIDSLRNNICAIKAMKAKYPFLTLFDLDKIESEIAIIYDEYKMEGIEQYPKGNSYVNCSMQQQRSSPVTYIENVVFNALEVKGSLLNQCQLLNLRLQIIELNDVGQPEYAVCKYFKSQGYAGAYCEGGAILIALKALCLDSLAEHNTFNSRSDACNRFFEAQCLILNDKKHVLLEAIRNTSKLRFIDNFKEIYSKRYRVRGYYPGLTVDFMSKLYDGVDSYTFCNIASRFMDDPYLFRKGWPDLTLIRGNELRFIEVKTTDRLHENQIVTIQAMRDVISSEFSVVKVVKK
jgi:hypothetical protein